MKVALITYHQVYNYGSSLQAYATKKLIEKSGCNVEIINYVPERFRNYGSFLQTYREKAYFCKNPLKCLLVTLICMPSRKKQKRVFSMFEHFLSLGSEIYREDLVQLNGQYDAFFTGSDQVWNNHYGGFDEAFFLDFVGDSNCYAYSASFGKDRFDDKELNQLRKLLSKYRLLSVREKSGLPILKRLGFTGVQLLDPVYTLSKNEWLSIAESYSISENYILVYQLNSRNCLLEEAIKLKRATNTAKIVVIEYERRKHDSRAEYESLPTVNRFLNLFAHAKYVVTDSFHGTSFSLKFNIEFFVALPPNFQGRIQSVLQLVGLENRKICKARPIDQICEESIDWDIVNRILEDEAQRNSKFISECINDIANRVG